MSVCLDSFALIAWLQDEPAAAIVEGHLKKAADTGDFSCYVSIVNLGEVYYRIWRLRGAVAADAFWAQAVRGVLPVELVQATRSRVLKAAQLKARFPIALADAFAVQAAREMDVPLVTGDPEIKALEAAGEVHVGWLPRRP